MKYIPYFLSWDVSGPNYGVLEDYEYQSTAEINQIQGGHSIQTHEYTGKKTIFTGPGKKIVFFSRAAMIYYSHFDNKPTDTFLGENL